MALTPDILNEPFNSLIFWTDVDTDTAVSEIDPAGWVRLDTNAGAAGDANARQYRNVGALPNQLTVQIKIFGDLIGSFANSDQFDIKLSTSTWQFGMMLGSDGCFIFKTGGAYLEIGTDIVKCTGTGAQIFRIEVDKSGGEAAAVCDIYLNNVLVGDNIDCDYEIAGTNGALFLRLRGCTTDNMVSHLDYIKIATGLGAIAEDVIPPDLLNEVCATIDTYTDGDTGAGVSEVYPPGWEWWRFYVNESVDTAVRYKTIASPPSQFTIEIYPTFTQVDTSPGYLTTFEFSYQTATWQFKVQFVNTKLYIIKTGGAAVEVGTNIVKCDPTSAFQFFRFQVDKTFGEASATVEVFLKEIGGVWVSYGVFDCDYEVAGSDGRFYLRLIGTAGEYDAETYIDYIKIGTGNGEFASFVPKIDIF